MAAIPEKIGKYVVSDEVARGGMGVVYKAVHPSLKRDVVIKKCLAVEVPKPENVLSGKRRFFWICRILI